MNLKKRIETLIEQNPGITQAEIRQATGAHRISVSRTLTDLQDAGLVVWNRRDDPKIRHYYRSQNDRLLSLAKQIGSPFGILAAQVMR